jgi:hypothetical protein
MHIPLGRLGLAGPGIGTYGRWGMFADKEIPQRPYLGAPLTTQDWMPGTRRPSF